MKQEDALLPLLIYFAFRIYHWEVEANQEGLTWKGKHELLVYADYVI
jgi:hypothetical protein